MTRMVMFGHKLVVDQLEEGVAVLRPDGWEVDGAKLDALRKTALADFQAEFGPEWDILISERFAGGIVLYSTAEERSRKGRKITVSKAKTEAAAKKFIDCYQRSTKKVREALRTSTYEQDRLRAAATREETEREVHSPEVAARLLESRF